MSDKSAEAMAYIGTDPNCGHIVAAVVDDSVEPTQMKRVAKTVAEFIKDGLTIARVTGQTVRDSAGDAGAYRWCTCERPKKKARR